MDSEIKRLDICINTNQIIYKAIELDPNLKNKNHNDLLYWCYDFLKRIKMDFNIAIFTVFMCGTCFEI